jgi:hypothetical protein
MNNRRHTALHIGGVTYLFVAVELTFSKVLLHGALAEFWALYATLSRYWKKGIDPRWHRSTAQ